jgi:hypothetical protein
MGRALSDSKVLEERSRSGIGTACRAADLKLDLETAFNESLQEPLSNASKRIFLRPKDAATRLAVGKRRVNLT